MFSFWFSIMSKLIRSPEAAMAAMIAVDGRVRARYVLSSMRDLVEILVNSSEG
jgi:hypothetical protein